MSNALIRSVPSASETPTFRAPPHNFEAEQALLGAILVNNEACDRVSSFLKSEHFYDPLHGRIYDHAAKLECVIAEEIAHAYLDHPNDKSKTIADMEEEARKIREEAQQLREENEQLRQELEALREVRESSQPASEDPYITHAPPTPERPVERPESEEDTLYGTSAQEAEESLQRRSSWWRRFFGFE